MREAPCNRMFSAQQFTARFPSCNAPNGIITVDSCRNERSGEPGAGAEPPRKDLLRAAWTLMTSELLRVLAGADSIHGLNSEKMYCSPVVRPCTTNLENMNQGCDGQGQPSSSCNRHRNCLQHTRNSHWDWKDVYSLECLAVLTSIHLICSCSLLLPVTIGGSQIEGWRKLHSDGGLRVDAHSGGCLQGPPARAKGRVPGWASPARGQGQGKPGGLCCSQWACGCRAPRRWSRPAEQST